MRIQWALLAEGITQDARGALTAVGLAQSVLAAPALPVMIKRAVVILLSVSIEEYAPGDPVRFTFRVESPSGESIAAHDGTIQMIIPAFPDLPIGINLAAESVFTVKEYGRHVVRVAAQSGNNDKLEIDLEFYVTTPPDGSIQNIATGGVSATRSSASAT
jgi:hypothetical protein